MRPQQQNRRMRGRNNNNSSNNSNSNNNNSNNNNRRGPNPLTRNYESNGPDVKIRGSAQQIAEKYATLARDAHTSGDRVMSENYLQHAEHYNRIIAAAQAQMPIQNAQPQQRGDDFDDDMDDDDNGGGQQDSQPQIAQTGSAGEGPQPVIEGVPAEVALNPDAANSGERQQRQSGYPNGTPAEGDDQQRRSRRRGRGRGRFDEDRGTVQADGEQGGDQPGNESGGDAAATDAAPALAEAQVERPARKAAPEPAPEAADVDPVS